MVLLQLAAIVLPTFGAPHWVLKVLIGVFVIFFTIVLILAWAFALGVGGCIFRGACLGRAPPATAKIPATSIAVLPFENLSTDKNNAYFTACRSIRSPGCATLLLSL